MNDGDRIFFDVGEGEGEEEEEGTAAPEEEDGVRVIEWAAAKRGARRGKKGGGERPERQWQPPSSSSSPPRRRCLDRPQWRRTEDCTLLQIQQKLASYAHQDQRRGRPAAAPALTVAATLALLESAEYRCTYCRCRMQRVWRAPRDPRQWTLDRVDNRRPHQLDNVVPSCMECNLRRRARGHAAFRRGADIVRASGGGCCELLRLREEPSSPG